VVAAWVLLAVVSVLGERAWVLLAVVLGVLGERAWVLLAVVSVAGV